MSNTRIQALLDDIRSANEHHHQLVQDIRALVMQVAPGAQEEVKYGGILFSLSSAFCGVFAYKAHVTLELGEGAQLEDSYAVLEGNGKFRRHIKLRERADIESKHLAHYIGLAAANSGN